LCRLIDKDRTNFSAKPNGVKWKKDIGLSVTENGDIRIAFLAKGEPVSPYVNARAVSPQIDIGMLQRWLQHCEKKHKECAHKSLVIDRSGKAGANSLKVLRVIDVKHQCIADAPDDCRFLTLSYVWGGIMTVQLTSDNFAQLTAKGGIANIRGKLPRTINDAIDLVDRMGERYLWVDQLCLIQDNNEDKAGAIGNMDSIYAGSVLTIVAAAGDNAAAGLPGVNPGRKPAQYIEEVKPGIRMTRVEGMFRPLAYSKYVTRGWTYDQLEFIQYLT
jgi:hypothetical protein